jgi:hypothetical protein
MTIKTAGYFRELPHGMQDGLSIRESVSSTPHPDKERIVNYLRNGWVFLSQLFEGSVGTEHDSEVEMCVDMLSDNKEKICPLRQLTDGVWAWPNDLGYYVYKYDVALPDEFVDHMSKNNWSVPDLTDEEFQRVIDEMCEPELDINEIEKQIKNSAT